MTILACVCFACSAGSTPHGKRGSAAVPVGKDYTFSVASISPPWGVDVDSEEMCPDGETKTRPVRLLFMESQGDNPAGMEVVLDRLEDGRTSVTVHGVRRSRVGGLTFSDSLEQWDMWGLRAFQKDLEAWLVKQGWYAASLPAERCVDPGTSIVAAKTAAGFVAAKVAALRGLEAEHTTALLDHGEVTKLALTLLHTLGQGDDLQNDGDRVDFARSIEDQVLNIWLETEEQSRMSGGTGRGDFDGMVRAMGFMKRKNNWALLCNVFLHHFEEQSSECVAFARVPEQCTQTTDQVKLTDDMLEEYEIFSGTGLHKKEGFALDEIMARGDFHMKDKPWDVRKDWIRVKVTRPGSCPTGVEPQAYIIDQLEGSDPAHPGTLVPFLNGQGRTIERKLANDFDYLGSVSPPHMLVYSSAIAKREGRNFLANGIAGTPMFAFGNEGVVVTGTVSLTAPPDGQVGLCAFLTKNGVWPIAE